MVNKKLITFLISIIIKVTLRLIILYKKPSPQHKDQLAVRKENRVNLARRQASNCGNSQPLRSAVTAYKRRNSQVGTGYA